MRVLGFLLLGMVGLVVGCGKAAPKPTRVKETAGPENKTLPSAQNSTVGMSNTERLQGVWVVDSVEYGHPTTAPKEEIKSLRFQFHGDRFVVTKGDIVLVLHTYSLDESKSPKWLTASVFNGKGEPTVSISTGPDGTPVSKPVKRNWIYKFDGEELVVAEAAHGDSNFRPTELKASPATTVDTFRPAVDVYHLKKTNEPPIAEALIPKIHDTKK